MTATWDASHLLLLWGMWAAMMAAMMLPSATPILLLYGNAARNRDGQTAAARIYALASGYVLVWATFSLAATRAEVKNFVPWYEPRFWSVWIEE